jgi:hypothetical protein
MSSADPRKPEKAQEARYHLATSCRRRFEKGLAVCQVPCRLLGPFRSSVDVAGVHCLPNRRPWYKGISGDATHEAMACPRWLTFILAGCINARFGGTSVAPGSLSWSNPPSDNGSTHFCLHLPMQQLVSIGRT